MNPQRLVILGSTGSIGRSTLDVVSRHPGSFGVVALAAYSNAALLAEQCRIYRPQHACLVNANPTDELEQALKDQQIDLHFGLDDLVSLAELPEAQMVVNAVVGAAGLHASLAALKAVSAWPWLTKSHWSLVGRCSRA